MVGYLRGVLVGVLAILGAGSVGASPVGIMFERTVDSNVDELSFSTYPTFDALLAGNPVTSQFSQINVHSDFNTTGLTWDGSRFVLMFERILDSNVDELSFSTYPTFDALLAGIPITSQFSQINVHSDFNTTGLFGLPPTGGGEPIPLPATFWLIAGGLGALTAISRQRRPAGSA